MKHRPDIDGLRAVAVIPVVLFHAGIIYFGGGYIGVDVFFVISGFLITGILLEDIRKERFSIASFYERRARRILPALFVVLLFASIAAYRLLMPNEARDYGRSLIATLFFVSNIAFSREMGYFDGPAELKPLLHTWSLAVEEQFYILYPLFLFLITRFFRKKYATAISSVLVVSFAYSVWRVHTEPATSFYLATTRAWELLIGGLLAIQTVPKLRGKFAANLVGFAGLGLIAYGVFAFSAATPFPGARAIFPCLGAALIIYSGMEVQTLLAKFLSLKPMVFVGLISYSLYLWHWVIIVYTKQYFGHSLTGRESLVVIAASFVCSTLAWKYVENPFRGRGAIGTRRSIFAGAAAVAMLFAVFGLTALKTHGFPSRLPSEARVLIDSRDDFWNRRDSCDHKICHLGGAGTPESFILWGDSHAGALAPAFERLALSDNISGAVAFHSGCAPLLHLKRYGAGALDCTQFGDSVIAYIRSHNIRTVFLHARWGLYAESLRQEEGVPLYLTPDLRAETNYPIFTQLVNSTLQELHTMDVSVVVIASVPEVGIDVPTALARDEMSGKPLDIALLRDDFMKRQERTFETLRDAAEKYSALIVYPHQLLCRTSRCSVLEGQTPLYYDHDHLSVHGAMYLTPLFENLVLKSSVVNSSMAQMPSTGSKFPTKSAAVGLE
jgi:peptidoglycan/LPS O-acetylase OafA/YrhL